jgi:hypothetical protein
MPESNDLRGGYGRRSGKQTFGMVLAAILGIVAVGLAVLGTTQKQVQIGLIIGLWAALIGLITVYGIRRRATPAELSEERGEVELRRTYQIGRERDAADRRHYALQLEMMLRREMERVLREELGALRAEVSALRSDVVEKVHGQLQLERIETTRVIGSDLEALQNEVRRLALARDSVPGAATGWGRTAIEAPQPATPMPSELSLFPDLADKAATSLAQATQLASSPFADQTGLEHFQPTLPIAPLPTAPPPLTTPAPASAQTSTAADLPLGQSAGVSGDTLAGPPRLGGLNEGGVPQHVSSPMTDEAPTQLPTPPAQGYVGRRRRNADFGASSLSANSPSVSPSRRLDDMAPDELLARLLNR